MRPPRPGRSTRPTAARSRASTRSPPDLKARSAGSAGAVSAVRLLGAAAGIRSSEWIAAATRRVIERERPTVTLCYLPHLDYDLQRFGPDSPEAVRACGEIDRVAGDLAEWAAQLGPHGGGALGIRDHAGPRRRARQPGCCGGRAWWRCRRSISAGNCSMRARARPSPWPITRWPTST